jgi:hypothetical protein
MDHLPSWLYERLRLLAQYSGAFVSSLPFGALYLVLSRAGMAERVALSAVVPVGVVVAYFAWRKVGKIFPARAEFKQTATVISFNDAVVARQVVFQSDPVGLRVVGPLAAMIALSGVQVATTFQLSVNNETAHGPNAVIEIIDAG